MLTAQALVAVCGTVLAACVGLGVATRASFTDFAGDACSVEALPYVVSSSASAERLELHDAGEVDEALAQAESEGVDVEALGAAGAADVLGLTSEDVGALSPLVVTGTFTGERTYVYQAFQCHVTVTSVLKGEGVSVGDDLVVYDGYAIREAGSLTEGGQFGAGREVWPTGSAPSQLGLTPLREGQEYLLFLEPKRYPAEKDPATYEQTYCMLRHPYARIALDVASHPERVGVSGSRDGVDWERIPFAEACGYDVFVTDDEARDLYLEGCEKVLVETLGA